MLLLGGFYTFEQPVLGAYYSVGALLPYVWRIVEATASRTQGEANTRSAEARLQGLDALPAEELKHLHARYDAILDIAAQRNPPRSPPPGTKRRIKHSPAHNLVERLREKRDDLLRFITDLRVPFDDNQAERDMRSPELKQTISDTFRTDTDIERFATVRSYRSTLHQQGADIVQALVLTFRGSPPIPTLGVTE